MSTNRQRRWCAKGKGPNGRNLCYCGCGREVPKGQRTTYEQKCYTEWAKRYCTKTQRRLVRERDKGVCAICGVNADQLRTDYRKALVDYYVGSRPNPHSWVGADMAESVLRSDPTKPAKPEGFPSVSRDWWEMDHIVPVIEGGGECDLSNLRTLCLPCHRKVTADLARRRAEARRAAKQALARANAPELEL